MGSPMKKADRQLAYAMLEDSIRSWRKLNLEREEAKPEAARLRKLDSNERETRMEIAGALDRLGMYQHEPLTIVVDGRKTTYARSEVDKGLDYESAWKAALALVSEPVRKKLEPLLKPNAPEIRHKLFTE